MSALDALAKPARNQRARQEPSAVAPAPAAQPAAPAVSRLDSLSKKSDDNLLYRSLSVMRAVMPLVTSDDPVASIRRSIAEARELVSLLDREQPSWAVSFAQQITARAIAEGRDVDWAALIEVCKAGEPARREDDVELRRTLSTIGGLQGCHHAAWRLAAAIGEETRAVLDGIARRVSGMAAEVYPMLISDRMSEQALGAAKSAAIDMSFRSFGEALKECFLTQVLAKEEVRGREPVYLDPFLDAVLEESLSRLHQVMELVPAVNEMIVSDGMEQSHINSNKG